MLRDSDEETPEASTISSHLNPAEVSGPASARSDFLHAQRWAPSALKEGQPFRLRRLPSMRSQRGFGPPRADRQRPNPAACLEPKYAAVSEIQNILESWNRFSAEHNSMRVVRRPPYFTSMFSDERSSEEICKYFTDVLLSAEF